MEENGEVKVETPVRIRGTGLLSKGITRGMLHEAQDATPFQSMYDLLCISN